jgi:hypothetical protein
VGGHIHTTFENDGSIVSGPVDAVAWTSDDGVHWQGPARLDRLAWGKDVTASGTQVVAVGEGDGVCINAWRTTIGQRSWTLMDDPHALCGDLGAEVNAVASLRGTYVATGLYLVDSIKTRLPLGLWLSGDGRTWQNVRGPAIRGFRGADGRDAIVWDGLVVIFGGTGVYLGQHQRATVWIGRADRRVPAL